MKFIMSLPQTRSELGLFIIRVGIGFVFLIHGFMKLSGGVEKWVWLGSVMQIVGITFAPMIWGLAAACAEFFGGLALILGCMPRIAAGIISCVMVFAIMFHLHNGDAWVVYSFPLSLLIVMLGLVVGGGTCRD
jgi:putative oxidoreductase